MSTQSVEYTSCSKIYCGDLPASVILCVPSSLVEPHLCPQLTPEAAEEAQTTEFSYIDAEIGIEYEVKGGCNLKSYKYVITYDDTQLVEGAVLTGDAITGILIRNCLTEYIDQIFGSEPYIRQNDDGTLSFVSNHGCEYQISSGFNTLEVADAAPDDADVRTGTVVAWVNEATNKLTFKVKYSDGATVKSGEVSLV